METLWLPPKDIEEVWTVNNRTKDVEHISSLSVSMMDNGYLPEYPMIVFVSLGVGVLTDKPFLLACGHHRREAAILAGIGTVFCEVHTGTEDDWIEMMSTDNFKFDVSKGGIGKAFTEIERRAACRQLLLLPKFLERTNVFLANEWNLPEPTVRRWRASITERVLADADDLKDFHISEDRLTRLKTVINSPVRLNDEGEAVTTTRNKPDDSPEARKILWDTIDGTAWRGNSHRSDGLSFVEAHGIDYRTFKDYCYKLFDAEYDSDIVAKASIRQLKELHNKMLTNDPEFVAALKANYADKEAYDEVRDKVRDTGRELEFFVCEKIAKLQNTFDDRAKACMKQFREAVSKQFDGFDINDDHAETSNALATYGETLKQIFEEVKQGDAIDWVQQFRADRKGAIQKLRQKREAEWTKTRAEMFDALEKYPRNISERALCTAMEDQTWAFSEGEILASDTPSELSDDTLKTHITEYKQWARSIGEDDYRIERIRAVDDEGDGSEASFEAISFIVTSPVGSYQVYLDREQATEWIPPKLYELLIEIATKRHEVEATEPDEPLSEEEMEEEREVE